MKNELTLGRSLLIAGLPLGFLTVAVLIMQSSFLAGNTLDLVITADLLVAIPLIYLLLISGTDIPKFTALPVMILGAALGTIFLPKEHQDFLDLFKTWALPGVEFLLLFLVALRVRTAFRRFERLKMSKPDFFTALKLTCGEMLPKSVAIPVATEIAVLYYVFFSWKRRRLQDGEFSYHKDSGTPTLLVAFIIIIVLETVILHLLLVGWSPFVAWLMTLLSLYTALQLLGFLKSMADRPVTAGDGKLYLRYGLMSEATIDIRDIEAVELSSKEIESDNTTVKLSIWGRLESHNVIIRLKKEGTRQGLYGFEKPFHTILLHIDKGVAFRERIESLRCGV